MYHEISDLLYYDGASAYRLKWSGGMAVLGARLMFCLYIVILDVFRMVPLKKGKNLREKLAPIFEETAALRDDC